MTSQRITAKMCYARAGWISSLTGLEIELTKDSNGWTAYHVDKSQGSSRRLSELFFADSTYTAFTALKAMYNLVVIMKEPSNSDKEAAASAAVLSAIGSVSN